MPTAAPHVYVYADPEALSRALAKHVTEAARAAVNARGRFLLALAGGSTPERLYNQLATSFADLMPWDRTWLFWGDERYVPHTDPASNYRMVRERLISRVDIPARQVLPVPTGAKSVEAAAAQYQATLVDCFGPEAPATFDLVLLGLGEDGHTASLFPEDHPQDDLAADQAAHRWVRAVVGPPRRPPRERVTLTLAAINAAREALFLVSGAAKAPVVEAIVNRQPRSQPYPAAYVAPQQTLRWYVDEAAFGQAV